MLARLTRRTDSRRAAPADELERMSTKALEPPAHPVLMRFLTQGGAEVHVTRVGTYTVKDFGVHSWGEVDDRWTCHGCDQGSGQHNSLDPEQILDAANEHAQQCRSMPKPTAA